MKYFIKSFMLIAAAALAFSSCNKEVEPQQNVSSTGTHAVNFTAIIGDQSKTTMTEGEDAATFEWSKNDEDRFIVYENNRPSIADETTGVIEGDIMKLTATFEDGATAPFTYTATLNGEVSASQTLYDGKYDESSDVLVAEPITAQTTSEVFTFKFKRVVALNKMTLKGFVDDKIVSKVVVKSDKDIVGYYDLANNKWATPVDGSPSTDIIIDGGKDEGVLVDGGIAVVYFNCVPVNDSQFTINVTTDKGEYTKTFSKKIALLEGKLNRFNVALEKKQKAEGYVKVTEEPSDWSGEYLLVYESSATEGRCWTGVDAASCFAEATIENGVISTKPDDAVTVTIASMDGGYSIKVNEGVNEGKYIYGKSGSNSIQFGSDAVANEITITDGLATILSNSTSFRYNSQSGNDRFRYYKTATTGTNYICPALYKLAGEPAPAKTLTSIAVSGTPAELWKGDEFNHNGITVTATWIDGSETDVTSSCGFTGYDMSTAGQQTVTVTYKDKTCTYNIEVKTIANTEATAYTVTDAKALIDDGKDLNSEVYVKGKVSRVDKYNDQFKSITYWLDDNTFEVYGGLAKEGEEFTSIDDIKVGADVVVKGKIKKFNSTYELDQNNHLVSYTAPAAPKTTATISLSGNITSLQTDSQDNVVTITYNGDGELSAESSDTGVATVSLEGTTLTVTPVGVGSTTVTVSAPETDNYTSVTKSYTLNVSAPVQPASLPFEFDGGRADIAKTDGMSHSGLGTDYSDSPKLKFDSTGDNVVINFNEAAKKVTYTIKGNSTSGSYAFDVMESADGDNYSMVHSHTSITDAASYTDNLASTSRFVKFVYTTKDKGNVALGNIKITTASVSEYTLTINSADNGSIRATVDNEEVMSGAKIEEGKTVTITATPADSGHEFDSWSVTGATVGTSSTETFTMTGNVTVGATFKEKQGGGTSTYTKVTAGPSDWSGTYVIAYVNGTSAFVYNGTDSGANNGVSATITSNSITGSDFVEIEIAAMNGGYSLKIVGGTNNGKYLSGGTKNGTTFGTTAVANSISLNTDGTVKINNNTTTSFQFNSNSDQQRFRYFTSSQKGVTLFKK